MLKLRIVTAAVLIGLLGLILFVLPASWAMGAFGAVAGIGAWEWARFGGLARVPARLAYAASIALLWLAGCYLTSDVHSLLVMLGLACAWWSAAFLWLVLAPDRHPRGLTLLCGALVLVPAAVALSRLEISSRGDVRGPVLVLWLLLIVFASDIGAFFAGRAFGRRKLAPRVSPGKTWEGAMGGLAATALVAWAAAAHYDLPWLPCIGFGCAVGIFSVIGDLTESMFKRAAGLKDSGALLPGHGGMMDRIDSITAAAPLYALGLFGSGVIA